MKQRIKSISLLLAAVLLFSGCGETMQPGETTIPVVQLGGDLLCVEISRFSGKFVEDGSDERVTDVAAILVANNTGKFVDLATVTYRVGGRTATFQITGLPSGERAWVLEKDRMTITETDELVYEDCQITYNSRAITETKDLAVTRQANGLTVENKTGQTMQNVCVYYKNRLEDGAFMGGITYVIDFGDLGAGETAQRVASHFVDRSEIVRYSYQFAGE